MAVIRTDYLRKPFTACGFDACAWQQAYYRHQAEFVRRKLRVIQAFAQDQTVARGALRQALRPVTVRQYLKKYVNEGLAGLCAPQQRPRASRLTAEQQAAFRHALLTSFPADHGLQGRICTGHPMRQYLLATWNAT